MNCTLFHLCYMFPSSCQSNPVCSVSFSLTETDHFLAPDMKAARSNSSSSSALSAHSRASSHKVIHGRYPTLFGPSRWNYPDSHGALQMGKEVNCNAVYINATLPLPLRHATPKINLISCHNCGGNVASRKLIPTKDSSRRKREKREKLQRLFLVDCIQAWSKFLPKIKACR